MGQALPKSYIRLMSKPVESVDWKQEASEFTRSMNLASLIEWQKFYTSGEKLIIHGNIELLTHIAIPVNIRS